MQAGIDVGIKVDFRQLDKLESKLKNVSKKANSMASSIVMRADLDTSEISSKLNNLNSKAFEINGKVKVDDASLERTQSKVDLLKSSLGTMFAGLAAGATVSKLSSIADEATNINSKLKLVTDSAEELNNLNLELFSLANSTRSDFADTVSFYQQVTLATKDLGVSSKDVQTVLKVTNEALALSGATAAESSSAMLQLKQALSSGVLQGDELRAIRESAPLLAKAIADGMDVQIGELKKLGAEGALTTEVVINAISKEAGAINKAFENVAPTISTSLTVASNHITSFVGEMDKIIGVSSAVSSAIMKIGDALPYIAALGTAFVASKLSTIAFSSATNIAASSSRTLSVAIASSKVQLIAMTGSATNAQIATSLLAAGMTRLGIALKTLAISNAPMIALTAAMEAYMYVTGEATIKQEELNKTLNLSDEAVKKLTASQAQLNLLKLNGGLNEEVQKTRELEAQLRQAQSINQEYRDTGGTMQVNEAIMNDETIALQAQLDTHIQNSNVISEQIDKMNSVVDGTYYAVDASTDLKNELSSSVNEAISLTNALRSASIALDAQINRAKRLHGQITRTKEIELNASSKLKAIDLERETLITKINNSSGSEQAKIAEKLTQLEANRLRVKNDTIEAINREIKLSKTHETVSKTHETVLKRHVSHHRDITSSINRQSKALIEAQKEAEEYDSKMKTLGDMLNAIGSHVSMAKLSSIYKEELSKMSDSTTDFSRDVDKKIKDIAYRLKKEFDNSFAGYTLEKLGITVKVDSNGFLESFDEAMDRFKREIPSLLTGLGIDAIQSISSSYASSGNIDQAFSEYEDSNALRDGLKNSGNPYAMAVGYAAEAISGALTEQKDAFQSMATNMYADNTSIVDSMQILANYSAPQLEYSKKMTKHLEDVNKNIGSLAKRVSGNTSFGQFVSGRSFESETKYNLTADHLGIIGGDFAEGIWKSLFGSTTTQLNASGVAFGEQSVKAFTDGIDAISYQDIETKSKYLFGLIKSSEFDTEKRALEEKSAELFQDIMGSGIDTIVDASELLGFDPEEIRNQVEQMKIEAAKFDFKDMSEEEINTTIQGWFGEQFSNMSEEAVPQIENLRLVGEDYLTALVRIGTEHEIVTQQLRLFGQAVTDFATSDALVQAAGGLESFTAGMNSFITNFFSSEEQHAMLESQLQYALAVYDIALPASKAQFKALVLETQQKIISLKAEIEVMKAEIAAKVEAGKISLEVAYGEVQAKAGMAKAISDINTGLVESYNTVIEASNESGKAAIGFGKSVNESIKAMITGTATNIEGGTEVDPTTGEISIDYDKITSDSIKAAEAELSKLEGLYGTLMKNMDSFASYYNDSSVENNTSSSTYNTQAIEDNTQAIEEQEKAIEDATIKIQDYNVSISDSVIRIGLVGLELERTTQTFDVTASNVSDSIKEMVSAMDVLAGTSSKIVNYTKSMQVLNFQEGAGGASNFNAGLDAYRNNFFTEEERLFMQQAEMLSSLNKVGIDYIPQTNEEFKNLIDTFKKGTPELDKQFGALVAMTPDFISLQKSVENVNEAYKEEVKKINDLKDYSTEELFKFSGFGASSVEALSVNLVEAINNKDYDATKSIYNDIINEVDSNENLTEKEKVFTVADANNLINAIEEPKKDDTIYELEKLREEVSKLNEIMESVKISTQITANNTEPQAVINGDY